MGDYYDLGNYHRAVSTQSAEAQSWFDRGLIWCYAYNHQEAVACFQKAVTADPDCAIAYWGIAYAAGPNYNKQWKAFDVVDLKQSLELAFTAAARALERMPHASPVERGLIGALRHRYPSANVEDIVPIWNDNYARAMREVYRDHKDDPDVATLFAEAIMNRTPWQLWNIKLGKPAEGADTLEAIEVLERAMSREAGYHHPGLLHMYVHLMEMSPTPEKALRAADGLRELVPDAGHLRHMATHIDVLCGDYASVVRSNTAAMRADAKFLAREGAVNFYTLYRCHNCHFIIYGAMFLGQYKTALAAAETLVSLIPEDLLRVESPPMADWLEGFIGMKIHVLIRFGKWREILAEPIPTDPALYCATIAMLHYGKAVAHAALGDIAAAEKEARQFDAAAARVPPTRYLFNNTCLDILAIAQAMMAGEIEYRKGNHETAFAHLRKAVELDDNLPYDEPWGWMQPTRHALGALLLEQGRIKEAEEVYRADLGLDGTISRACLHPENLWSLHGLHECLARRGSTSEARAIKQRLDLAAARADVPIKSSCFCRIREAA